MSILLHLVGSARRLRAVSVDVYCRVGGRGGRGLRVVVLCASAFGIAAAVPAVPSAFAACPNEALRTGPSAGLPDCRAYEMVTPPDKPGGQGVGSYGNGGDADAEPGMASIDGNRYISSTLAGNLTPGGFLYAMDYALSGRASHGWVSHSPFTHYEYGQKGGANVFFTPRSASDDLSMFGWQPGANGGAMLFPEMASWPSTLIASYVTDWQGRWELEAPTDLAVGGGGSIQFESADGSHVPFQTTAHGQLGSSDPSLDQNANTKVLYDDDLSAGLSDQFNPNGVRSLVGVCTGSGSERTRTPSVDASGKLGAESCPAAAAGRSAALISPGGAAIDPSGSTKNAVSDDGSRTFFMSPDPTGTGRSKPPSKCSGTGAATVCPPQLYVNQRNPDGSHTVRWMSKSAVADQDASLAGPVFYEGASATGSKVFFRTDSPLTADDPNGTGTAPVKTGSADASSWDLYEYDVPSGPDGRPDGTDPGSGSLTRVSAGPLGTGDCNAGSAPIALKAGASLRFASDDGTRLYFVCAAPLSGVATNSAPTDGTITTAGLDGKITAPAAMNLYYYDSTKPLAQRWEFVAQLPYSSRGFDSCATSDAQQGDGFSIISNGGDYTAGGANCFKGTADGRFVTFMTSGKLVAGDPESDSVDVYAFDADADKLIRIDAPQGGSGDVYGCQGAIAKPTGFCHGDSGFSGVGLGPLPGVATKPANAGDRIAFFESRSRLVPQDVNDEWDVYEWDDGKLSLLSAGTGPKGSYYAGNSASGRDVFIETRDQLTWKDYDAVMDVYDARVDGGFPPPSSSPAGCDVTDGACQGQAGGGLSPLVAGSAVFSGRGNVSSGAHAAAVFHVRALSRRQQRRFARGRRIGLRVRVSKAGKVRAVVRGRLGRHHRVRTLAHGARSAKHGGTVRVRLRLSKRARRYLSRHGRLRIAVRVRYSKVEGAQRARVTLRRHRGRRAAARSRRARRASSSVRDVRGRESGSTRRTER